MIEHECDFPDTCPVCLGSAPTPAVEWSRPFTAKFAGHCPICNLPTHVGERVMSDGKRIFHEGCVW